MKSKETETAGCFICGRHAEEHRDWVKYHIAYDPPLWIWACNSCNYLEYLLRSNIDPSLHGYENIKDRRNKINELRKIRKLDRL
jgi:hypothetical protein